MISDEIISRIMSFEGGYVNDPKDSGGETKFGISKRAYPKVDIKSLTVQTATEIYKRDYWNKIRGDELHPAVAFVIMDTAVNSGVSRSVTLAQQQLEIPTDGNMGPRTIQLLGSVNPWEFVVGFSYRRLYFLTRLDSFNRFGAGWSLRIMSNLQFSLSYIKDLK